jgi:hypothetical protein
MKTNATGPRVPAPLALLLLALAGAGCMMDVEATIPDLELTQRDIRFDGVPKVVAANQTSMSRTYQIDDSRLRLARQLYSELHAMEATIVVTSGPTDLEFLRNLRLTMRGRTPESDRPLVTEILDFEHKGGELGTTLLIKSPTPIDVTGPWLAEDTAITLDVSGWLPSYEWTADITLRLKGKVRYKQ